MKDILWPGLGGPSVDYITSSPDIVYRDRPLRQLVILGSTGSIGRNALSALETCKDRFRILGLACGRNIQLLAQQATNWRPQYLAVLNPELAAQIDKLLPPGYEPEILAGSAGYATLASLAGADCVLSAQAGAAGLAGTLSGVLAGKVVALANKESLVIAGGLIRRLALDTGASILPVDSEHYAIFQCLAGRGQSPDKIILTASGGPFFGYSAQQLESIGIADALAHPNWKMGAKITIDSATLMNKGLEVIEAAHLFGISIKNIQVLVHPQSIIHSLVQFADNSILAQLAIPDMRLPIAACLNWPRVMPAAVRQLDLTCCGNLQFFQPDLETFPALALALKVLDMPLSSQWAELGLNPWCAILNAANEAAVELFLRGKLGFGKIPAVVEQALLNLHHDACMDPGQIAKTQKPALQALAYAGLLARLDGAGRQFVANLANRKDVFTSVSGNP